MQRILLLALIAVFTLSCNNTSQDAGASASEDKVVELVKVTVEELTASPVDFMDKEVAISGMVTHVCRHGGQKCFIVGEDGETQIRIVPSGDIDEFKIDLEGSDVAFKGTFRMLTASEAAAHVEDHDSKEHHSHEMAHTQAEKADIFIEAVELKELTQ